MKTLVFENIYTFIYMYVNRERERGRKREMYIGMKYDFKSVVLMEGMYYSFAATS